MAVIYSSDLAVANSSSMITSLKEVMETSTRLMNKLTSFMSESRNHLEGDVFSIINAKLSMYVDALQKQNQICENLIGNVKAANNTMINYMECYDKLDDGEAEEIRGLLNQINNSILTLESQKGNRNISIDVDIYRLNEMYSELNKHYQKLKGLAAADNSAFCIIEGVTIDVANYADAVSAARVVSGSSGGTFYNMGGRDVMYYDQRGHYVDGEFVKWESEWRSSKGGTIYEGGCGPTSCATVLGTMFHDPKITPETIANVMLENNWSNFGGGFVKHVSDTYGVNCVKAKFSGDALEEIINSGGGYIGSVESGGQSGGHFIAVTDVVYQDGQRYFVLCDSWPPGNADICEPTLVTEGQLKAKKISMSYYITPPDVEVTVESTNIVAVSEKDNKIENL